MGTTGAARVDPAALRSVSREYETAASILDGAVRNHLSALHFGGSAAGRAYTVHGEEIHSTLTEVTATLRQWSRAAAEIAVVLRASVHRYEDADARLTERLE
jgi:hypothetical protein